ncbi:MAG: tetratricopeptide repeat protein, partial [Deltaproteobacteria bacterium]|nr:tetratricopeptide repeat protein [Deltaproteobacteria bacterium]
MRILDNTYSKTIYGLVLISLSLTLFAVPADSEAWFFDKKTTEEGEKITAKKHVKNDAFYYFSMAQAMKSEGDIDSAINFYKKAIDVDPSSP